MITSSQHLVENNKSPLISIRKQLTVSQIRVKHLVENNALCVGGFKERVLSERHETAPLCIAALSLAAAQRGNYYQHDKG